VSEGEDEARRSLRISPFSSARFLRACRANGVEARLDGRYGLPALAFGMLKRPGIVIGTILSVAVLVYSGSVIWDVRIEGNEKLSDEAVELLLEECGVGVGSKKNALDIDSIENRVLILSDDISWISINVLGNVAEVEIRESAPRPEEKEYVSSNLVAARNGTVLEFLEVRGNIAVTLGEAVSKDQLLVGGIYGSNTEGLRFVRSSGRVIALCEREYRIEVPLSFEKKVYTGRRKVKKSLVLFKKEVNFFRNSRNLYASCDTIEREEYLNFFGLGELPVGIRTVEYVEYEITEGIRSEEQAAEQANFLLWQRYFAEAPEACLASKELIGQLEGDKYILIARIESIENIAVEREIEVEIVR
jgi:similar to stage IV sporulation protein